MIYYLKDIHQLPPSPPPPKELPPPNPPPPKLTLGQLLINDESLTNDIVGA
jgi:hypothetical protein